MPVTSANFDSPALSGGEMLRVSQDGLVGTAPSRKGRGYSSWVALAIGLLILLVPFSATFQHSGNAMDEGALLVYPEMVQRGAIPYRDFETFYGPANLYVLAAAFTVFGTSIETERTVGLLYRVMILIALFALARQWGTPIATGCMMIAGILLLPLDVIAYAWLGAVACALCFIWAMAAPGGKRRCFVAGLLAGLAVVFRVDVGLAVALAACALLWPLSPPQRLRFAYGAAIGLIPFAILLLLAGAEQMFNNLFLYPVILSGPGRRIPLFSAEPFLVRLFFLQVLAAAVNVVAGVLAVRRQPTQPRNRVLLALALLGAGMMPQAWQRLDLCHLLFVAFLVIGVLPMTLLSLASSRSGNRPPNWFALGSTLLVAVFVSVIVPFLPQLTVASVSRRPAKDAGRQRVCPARIAFFPGQFDAKGGEPSATAGQARSTFEAGRTPLRRPCRSPSDELLWHLHLSSDAEAHSGDLLFGDEPAVGKSIRFATGRGCAECGLAGAEPRVGLLGRAQQLIRVCFGRAQHCGAGGIRALRRI